MRHNKFAMLGLSAALVVSLLLVARVALAEDILNLDLPASTTTFDPCTGEDVLLSGTIHLIFRVSADSAGGLHIGLYQVNAKDIKGVGLTSGTVYVDNGSSQFPLISNARLDGASELSETVRTHLIATGGGPDANFFSDLHIHGTVNADGTITADFVDSDFVCQ
jgi:hypothetical protein